LSRALQRLRIHWSGLQTDIRTIQLARQVYHHSILDKSKKPVIFFNASTRLNTLSQNAAFSLLTAWAVRLAGQPVIHFVCQAGMSRCVLGTDQENFEVKPPCQTCIRQSRINTHAAQVRPFIYKEDQALADVLIALTLDQLVGYEHAYKDTKLPLGALVLPSIRWRLRRSTLEDNEATRFMFRQFMLSAWNVAINFSSLLEEVQPQAVLVFNGQFFPEVVVRWLCKQHGIFSVTHEVAMQPLSGFFTDGEATAYPISIPEDFSLTPAQDTLLDGYLEKRLQGNFSMAGIRFWPEMKALNPTFLDKAAHFKQIVPIFTNVIFDTSQAHSNTIFKDMFAWLDQVLELIQHNPETLFVLRAHPDEKRIGKQSEESVSAWAAGHQLNKFENVVFVDANETISSYELIERSKFIMIYNSTIGLEATILGKAVLAAGRSRFTSYPIVFFPNSTEAYTRMAEEFLTVDRINLPEQFRDNARRFLYYLLYRASLPFDSFLEASVVPGVVQLKKTNWQMIANSTVMKTIVQGLVDRTPILINQD
jgi:hypothetical protein